MASTSVESNMAISGLATPLNIDMPLQHQNLQVHHNGGPHQHQQQPSPNYQPQPAPWSISEANSHCVYVLDRLRVQREQSRFADLILSVRGREFAAHRCVLAAPWFDARLKVHKSAREHIAIDQCKDYEIFYALLTYCYTGNIVLDQHNVPELLSLAVLFQMVKLKSHCCEYLNRNLCTKNIHIAVDLAHRHGLGDLIRRSFNYLHRSFAFLFENDREELMQYSPQLVQAFLQEKGWAIYPELVIRFIASWVNYDLAAREEYFLSLLYYLNWSNVSAGFVCRHLDEDPLYHNSQEALFSILTCADRNNIYLGQKFHDLYQSLQDRILPEQELDELNDSNSFLSMAINSAVKDLEHSEVDTDFFLQNDPFRPPPPVVQDGLMGPPPPPPPPPSQNSLPQPPVLPSSSSIIQQPIQHVSYLNSLPSTNTTVASTSSGGPQVTTSSKTEKLEKFKDSFEFEIVEQLINEQQSEDKTKYRDSSSVKRYDPKYRALTEAFRQMEDEHAGHKMYQQQQQQQYPPHPKQRHLSNNEHLFKGYYKPKEGMHNMPQRVNFDVGLSTVAKPPQGSPQETAEAVVWTSSSGATAKVSDADQDSSSVDMDPIAITTPEPPQDHEVIYEEDSVPKAIQEVTIKLESTTEQNDKVVEFRVESKKKLASKERRAKAVALMEENADAVLLDQSSQRDNELPCSQNQHVKKAKLLAEHRETLQRTNSLEAANNSSVPDPVLLAKKREEQPPKKKDLHSEKKIKVNNDCPICTHRAKSKMELNKHLSKDHLLEPPFRCTHQGCNYETKRLQTLLTHTDIHSTGTIYSCAVENCNYKSTTIHRMKFHSIIHSDSVHECDKCDKKFSHRSALFTHQLVHETVKRLQCGECDFSTKYKNHLATHMRIHRGDVLKCDLCTYTTPKKNLMIAHERAHKKERNFKCEFCEKAFVENSALTRHKRIHSDDLPFACTECAFKTRRRDKLKHHLLKKHKLSH